MESAQPWTQNETITFLATGSSWSFNARKAGILDGREVASLREFGIVIWKSSLSHSESCSSGNGGRTSSCERCLLWCGLPYALWFSIYRESKRKCIPCRRACATRRWRSRFWSGRLRKLSFSRVRVFPWKYLGENFQPANSPYANCRAENKCLNAKPATVCQANLLSESKRATFTFAKFWFPILKYLWKWCWECW